MRRFIFVILFVQCFNNFCAGEISSEKKEKYLNGLIDYLNSLPNQAFAYEDGVILNAEESTETGYKIEARIKANDLHNLDTFKYVKCTGTVRDAGENEVSVDAYQCQDDPEETQTQADIEEEVTGVSETPLEHEPVKLDNEVQTDTAVTSGEQFFAVPRGQGSAPCIGCASSVNPEAAGVPELASLGVKQLNEYDPKVGHTLNKVVSVERQVQVVNGVRYILTLLVDYNSCSSAVTETCMVTKPCKVSVLEKPWVKLPDGSKYRRIVSNNCTSDWIFREEEELGNSSKNDGGGAGLIDEMVTFVHNKDVQSQPGLVKALTDDDIKKIQEQIISHDNFKQTLVNPNKQKEPNEDTNTNDFTKHQNFNTEVKHIGKNAENVNRNSDTVLSNDINLPDSQVVPNGLSTDKKKTIDDLMNFFDFSSFNPKPEDQQNTPRIKRSYDNDLKVFRLAEKFSEIKKTIKNTKYLYALAEAMVSYLNEIDMEIKNRVVKNVLSAEEESDVTQHFYYLQVLVEIPCQKVECDKNDKLDKVCNGVIDTTHETNPQVLNVFCYDIKKNATNWGKMYHVPVSDPILQNMAISALKKIESESPDENALKLVKIINGNTQKLHGILTKITVLIGYTKCKKTENFAKRSNCTVERDMGSKICDIDVLQRRWLKENKITYVCTERPASESFVDSKKTDKNVNDRSVQEIVQEALQFLEVQSNRNNKQKVVEIKSVSTQLVAGLLTNIDFTVGYTICTNEFDVDVENCKLIKSEPLRHCQAQVWHRPWLEDGRQMNVSCNNTETSLPEQDDLPDQELIESLRSKRESNSLIYSQKPREKRQIPGGSTEENPNDPKYLALAEESLQKYIQTSGSYKPHSVTKVDRVTTQVVAGTLTEIYFTVNVGNSDVIQCHSKVWERPWLQKKEITVNCGFESQGLRKKREILGGYQEQNPNDPKYLALAEESLQKYIQSSGSTKPHIVTKVDRVRTQVVSGLLTKIDFTVNVGNSDVIQCHSKVWERPWLQKKEITVNCGIENQGSREKRQIPGGYQEQNPNDPEYLALAKESLQKYLQTSGSSKPHSVTKVDRVRTQVVEGFLTKIDFTVNVGNFDIIQCYSEVWERPWLQKKEITVNCGFESQGLRKKWEILGGYQEQNPNDPKYLALAEESLQKYIQSSGSTKPHIVTKVDRVRTQVVSGFLTKIDFTVNVGNSDVIQCHSKVWERSRLEKKEITVNCGIENQGTRKMRQITGGYQEQNPNNPEYLALAEESLQKYIQSSGSTKPHIVTKVDRVRTQVVSGLLTKIDFTVNVGNSDVIQCHSKVWERSRLEKKEITVNCGIENQGTREMWQITGGYQEQNPNDPEYLALAEESLQKYIQSSGSTKPHIVTKVDRVRTQVVSGFLTKIDFTVNVGNSDVIQCHSEVWERSRLEKKEITVNCGIENQGTRVMRQIAGGSMEKNPNDPKYLALAEESLQKYIQTSGSSKPHSVTKVDRVTTQVVAGTLTNIYFTVNAGNSDVIQCHSKVWERQWLQTKEITVNCGIENQGSREKRQIPGGYQEQNPNDPEYLALAEESLQKYIQSSGSTKPHIVTKVDRVRTQVVSGLLTKIDFTVNVGNSDVIQCHSKVWERQWLQKKEITVNCGIENQGSREKRQIPGGYQEQNPNDPKYLALAKESLQKYLQTSGSSKPHSVTKVDRVRTQVVEGFLTKIDFTVNVGNFDIIQCYSEVWERPWLQKKEITVNCGFESQGLRKKWEITGGYQEQNPNDPKYLALAEESLQKYIQSSGSTKPHIVTKVDRVRTQVVSGLLTKIDFTVNVGNSDVIQCHSKVRERSRLEKKEITVYCGIENQGTREQIAGGSMEKNPNDPKYLALAEESLQKYLQNSGSSKPHSVTKVDRVRTQVVSGFLTKIDFTVNVGNFDIIQCYSEVWERPWLQKKEITVNCGIENQSTREMRQIAGGSMEQNPNDPKYLALAEESLQKYIQSSGSTKPHIVTKVDRVRTQVVEGFLTKIDFTVNVGNFDIIQCYSEVWERPWLQKKEITVNCGFESQGLRKKRQFRGGSTEQNPNDPKYLALAEESLQIYIQTSGSSKPHSVTKVDRVTTQVVAGTLTNIYFTVNAGNSDVIQCHSKVWERQWLQTKEITVNCGIENQDSREKRQIPGGYQEQNPNDPEYLALAEESLQKYIQSSGSTKPHIVTKVDRVRTQVVSGLLTKIDFTVNVGNSDVIQCHSKVWERPWLQKKEITVKCGIENQGTREMRQIAGGYQEQNPNDPKYLALAKESLQKYIQNSGSSKPHSVTKVDRVRTQLIEGFLTQIDFTVNVGNFDIIQCYSEVWERPWLQKKQITVNCGIENQGTREMRQIAGGSMEQNPNDPKYLALAEESLQKYIQSSGSTKPHIVTKVDRVRTQVVEGFLTKIDFTVNVGNFDIIQCYSEVWERPWLQKKEITVNCGFESPGLRKKREILGGYQEQNPNDPKYLALAEESLQKYIQSSGSTKPHIVTKVDRVRTQVVSGLLTKIDFTVNVGNSDVIQCHSKVWERPWLQKKEITVNCGIENQGSREKRQIPGGYQEQNPNDPKYLALAKESLQKYLQTSGSSKPHSVTKVDRVRTQVVEGFLTQIDFTVNVGNFDIIQCYSEVWERPWLQKKELTVNCGFESQGLRKKRQILGGDQEKNPNDPKYLALAEESLQKYIQTSGSSKPHSVTKVDRVTTQVVAGALTKIDFTVNVGNSDVIQCHSEVWEKPWLKEKDITVNCGTDENKLRGKRQALDDRISGAPIAQDHTLPEYLSLAETCLNVYLRNMNSTQHHKVIRVKEVTTQPVAGVMTRLVFLVSPTNCHIDSKGLPSADSCDILDETDIKRCFAKVWDKPWKSLRTISVDCKLSRSKREIVSGRFKTHNRRLITRMGSEVEQDPSKEKYRTLAEESLRKYQHLQKSEVIHTVLEVKRVLTKLVSGTIYKIDFTAKTSNCSKNTLNVSSCSQLNENQTIYCHSEVWDRPWLGRKDIKVDCISEHENLNDDEEELSHKEDEEDAQLKRGLLGGSAPQDITAERFKIIANAATRKFESSGKTKYVHKVVKIDEATEQIIDGSLVIVKFTVYPTTCLIKDAKSNVEKCLIQDNDIKLQCTARVLEQIALELDEDKMRVSCKRKNKKHEERQKRSIEMREKRQNRFYDDEIDEETKYYYADKAVQYLNDHSSTHNMQKLVTIHSVQNSMHMRIPMVRMYLETAYTYCLRDERQQDLHLCDELDGMSHRLCLAKLFPAADDELIVHKVHVVCDDDTDFTKNTGLAIPDLVAISVMELERSPNIKYKLVHQGEPNVAPSLDVKVPVRLHFIVASTNCTKDVEPKRDNVACYVDTTKTAKSCLSYIWIVPNEKRISRINANCNEPRRRKRSLSNDIVTTKSDDAHIKQLVQESLEKLEMSSLHRYKQRVLLINSYSTKISTGKVTTLDFDVGYTNCLKYEWIDNITKCEFLEHLPRRHCVSQVWERLWIHNGRNIEVNCEDDETPLESRIEFESAETAMQLAKHSLKHIEAKYPHPKKQQVVRIFSLEKQAVAGIHYRMKLEIGFTNCSALSFERGCTLVNDGSMNRFCRVNVWLRPWTNHPPIYRVSCDYQDGTSTELYHHIQAEQLFYNFLTTYKPDYINDHVEMTKRFEIFKDNIRKIHELNIYELGTATYTVNRFADLTQEEFSSKYLGLKPSLRDANQVPMPEAKIPKVDIPEAFDWRTYGAVTPVKDQGSCGSCWAFSVTGNIEGQWKIQTGDLVSLSEQELVDCDKLDHGCNGGLPDNAYRSIEELGGLETENDYPYEGEDDKCSYNKTQSRVHITGAVNISSNETEMAQWLVHNGPISIGINANAMQFYRAGISHPWRALCNPDNLDHGVLIVGFGVKDYPLFHKRLPYWIVKNSWGASWGEEGYYRVYRGDGTCGVNKMASSAVV